MASSPPARPVLLSRSQGHYAHELWVCRIRDESPRAGLGAGRLGGVVDGCFRFFAAVEGSKERDEGSPTSGAWGGSVERCLSGGGKAEKNAAVVK